MSTEKLLRLSDRLRQMELGEMADRCRQAIAKRYDAVLGLLGYDFVARSISSPRSDAPKFFFSRQSLDGVIGLVKERLPGRAEQIVQEAEEICKHSFNLLGYSNLDYSAGARGWNIDWHWDAVHNKRAPKKAFYKIRYLDYEQCGDSKVIWELNRHQHLVTLAKAACLIHDLRYVDEILRQWRHWQAENPYPMGINWASSLEAAFRSLSWLWTYHLLQAVPGVSEIRGEWLRGLALHGRHIERYLSTYFSPNTHLLGEGVALFFIGVLCPELEAAERWKVLGWKIVVQESERQIQGDGFHFEQSTYYHVYALDFFLHAALLASLNTIPIPKSLEDKLEKMLSALALMSRFGPPPGFGDDDGGRLFDPRRNRSEHLADPLAAGAILFHRGDFKSVAATLREETLWLLGAEGVRQWDELEETEPDHDSVALAASGYYLLAADDAQLIVDAGPLGTASAGHGHADALSVCLQNRGQLSLIDSGTFEYVGANRDRRNQFRGTAAHNTVRVDGLDQTEVATVFSWKKLTKANVEHWVSAPHFDLLIVSHNGYERLPRPVTHHRWILSLRNGIYLIRDFLVGSGICHIEIPWHCAADLPSEEDEGHRTSKTLLLPVRDSGWKAELRNDVFSPAYGGTAPMHVLTFVRDLSLPAQFATLLNTSERASAAAFLRQLEPDQHLKVSQYEFQSGQENYLFFYNDRGGTWRSGSTTSDAKFVCYKKAPPSHQELFFCDGTYATVDEAVDLRCTRRVGWAELIVSDQGCQSSSSEGAGVIARAYSVDETASIISGEL